MINRMDRIEGLRPGMWRIIVNRKWTVLAVLLAAVAAALLVTLSADPVYRAAARVLVERAPGGSAVGSGNCLYDPDLLETQAQIIPIPLSSTAKKVHHLARAAVGIGAVLANENLYPPDAFLEAANRLQKAKAAETNIEGLKLGLELM